VILIGIIVHHNGFLIFEQRLRHIGKQVETKIGKMTALNKVIHEKGTSEFLFCRNQQYQWQ
jgi:hypothetical protein